MNRKKCNILLAVFLLLALIPAAVLGITYVFPYEGFRYTQQQGETVLTQINLNEHADFLTSLGTDVDTVLASFVFSGTVMEVIPESGGQISVSVSEDTRYLRESMSDLSTTEREAFLQRFEESGLYETCSLTGTNPECVRLVSSAMYASMPVYSLRYITLNLGKLYTLDMTVIGRPLEEEDDAAVISVLSGMRMFEARPQAQASSTPQPLATPAPEQIQVTASVQSDDGSLVLENVPTIVYEESFNLNGKAENGASIVVTANGSEAGRTVANSEGSFTVRTSLSSIGTNLVTVSAGEAEVTFSVEHSLPRATLSLVEPTQREFTGESVLISGNTVPDATVYVTGSGINTNVRANRNGVFNLRLSLTQAGDNVLNLRVRASGYAEYETSIVLTRVLTEREQLAAFRASIQNVNYADLAAHPENYADVNFIFRGKVMEYTDYNGNPCALICTNNPSTGNWWDPLYVVIESGEEVPAIGSVITFYLTGEGIALPADGRYSQSGWEVEAPVGKVYYMTTNR